ncbi:tRNA 5-methoxyuridine(34)/uridine 5-oxyacetic acid(34) synthase CmoB [Sulfuricurvum sp.]|uniref:tRNA 5-methoxyuridine(34)/uridine 5-oxyacetic acid(34) synthase CmoB n=1 Tax=Sulfuricurvum sp. TaxID=2025608 RepID=UPI002636F1BD|nr:tRNA 5-methoxyuridine(34)/uridine 5-oxyacetic acid(34) synthase CmoB [Sulfuricurvum sp.]MDD2266228.1 tRNA 5-methoxyuridine(34)/uridine 5-oxyacetic acid(34) synthase CmoB [Sulfuricurvum sp.]MDD2783162.1 tRNA 5-methoxyuridine(34)/uridine 5-oxyacetic acid(34) synthase CmoB [Sulfuricurvum sp.]HZF71623.1 tRNA 5-methoxyuridine(34)/uridine 5-oxyacetic acid(34) synthase CmoB [Sulfuricurvum sp.]
MDLNAVRQERSKWMTWKNIAPLRDALNHLPDINATVDLGDTVSLKTDATVDISELERIARLMMPWRKGPFDLFGLFIDTEWRSDLKYNFLRPHFNLSGKKVADIGCNNGYYMFRFLEDSPAKMVGFDPSALFKSQFDLINHYVKSDIVYELLGVEHLPFYEEKFDVIFCLGVLYHRSDPIAMLKTLRQGLEEGGEVYLDTFIIDGNEPVALCPSESYSKITNVYFVPTLKALENWCIRAGFTSFEVLGTVLTTSDEQRKTDWIESQSLEDFLDPADSTKTVEGYPAPKRGYIRIKKG